MEIKDISNFPNTSGWHIIHDSNNMCYKIKSEKGQTKNEIFTHKSFAERALYKYLSKVSEPVKKKINTKTTEEK
jgi:hypothetical protein